MNIDTYIYLVSETKLNDAFPDTQFIIDGFHSPYRKERMEKWTKAGVCIP